MNLHVIVIYYSTSFFPLKAPLVKNTLKIISHERECLYFIIHVVSLGKRINALVDRVS